MVESLISIHKGPGLDPQYSQKKGGKRRREGGREREEGGREGKHQDMKWCSPRSQRQSSNNSAQLQQGTRENVKLLGKTLNTETFKTSC